MPTLVRFRPTPIPFALIDRGRSVHAGTGGYDLVRTGEDRLRLDVAVVGFGEDDLEVEVRGRTLTVRGRVPATVEGETVLHQGVARRPFERTFTLGEHVRVDGARLQRGLLSLDLVRDVPEDLRPRSIPIAA